MGKALMGSSSVGIYLNEIDRYPVLTREQEQTATADELIKHNMRLVVHIARKYSGSLPLEDRIAEGSLGLMIAAQRFNPELGYKFSTYATYWIHQAIRRAVHQDRCVRLPEPFYDLLRQYHDLCWTYLHRHGRMPHKWEVRKQLNCTTKMYKELLKANKRTTSSLHELCQSKSRTYDQEPYDPVDHREDRDPPTLSMHAELREWLEELIQYLPLGWREVIVCRFGLDGERPETLEEIAIRIGRTRERIRQIETAALKKLYHHAKRLRPFDDSYCEEVSHEKP